MTELLDKYKREIESDYSVTQDQRDAANEDMRFIHVDGGMWEGWLSRTHGYNTNRARLEFDITSDYVNRFISSWIENKATVNYSAADPSTDEDDAKLLNSIYRADYRDFDGEMAIDLAVNETAECGCGAFKLCVEYEDEGDEENDNVDIHFKPIHNAFNHVIWDSNAKRADKADAKRCTVLTQYTKAAFEEEFPDINPVSAYDPQNRSFFNWNGEDMIWVAERYEVKEEKTKTHIFQHVLMGEIKRVFDHQLKDAQEQLDKEGWTKVRERKIKKRVVYKSILTGSEFIEKPKRIMGEWIPVIPMYGFRRFIDGVEHYRGLVRKMKDANRVFNTNISRMTDTAATSPNDLDVYLAEQVEGHETNLADNTNKSYQVINAIEGPNGEKIVSGPVGKITAPQVDPNTLASTELVSNFVQRSTGDNPQESVNLKDSGVALQEIKKHSNLSTRPVMANIHQSIKHSGKVYMSIMKEAYSVPRLKSTLAVDGEEGTVQLMEMRMNESGEQSYGNNISSGRFKASINIGPQYQTQQEATLDSIERIMDRLDVNSDYFTPLMAMWIQNVQGTGLEPLKAFNRNKMLMTGLVKPENDDEKQFVQMVQNQPDTNAQLTEAMTNQQNAEAQNLQASSLEKMANAKLKQAQAAETISSIGIEKAKVMSEFMQRRLEQLSPKPKRLRYNPETGELENAGTRAS